MQHSTANTILTTSTKQLIKACSIKLLYDSLPTYLTLNKRGIPVASTCPLCNVEDESISHLFLFCPFARATWHGSPLAVHTSDLHNTSIQQWIGTILLKHKKWTKTWCITCKQSLLLFGPFGLIETWWSIKENILTL